MVVTDELIGAIKFNTTTCYIFPVQQSRNISADSQHKSHMYSKLKLALQHNIDIAT